MTQSRQIDAMSRFAMPMALQLGTAAELAYSTPEQIEQAVMSEGNCEAFCSWDVEAVQCFVAAWADRIILFQQVYATSQIAVTVPFQPLDIQTVNMVRPRRRAA